ncbi:MAG TPA: hypothetical protein VF505_15135, partial [Thermoanaerobaculia bacterium]
MISSSSANGFSASEEAIATLKADEAFKGKHLGEAAPNDGTTNTPASLQEVTGQFIPPSAYANPQVTVNSSISSAPTPAIVSGEGVGVDVTIAAPAATTADAMNATTSALTNTTATPITNTINTQMINTGIAAAVVTNSTPTAFQRFMSAIG